MSNEIIDVEFKDKSPVYKRYIPLVLTLIVILVDQITKFLIEANFEKPTFPGQGYNMLGGFISIDYLCNPGIAFSMLSNLSQVFRWIALCIVPLLVLFVVLGVFLRNTSFSQMQRWAIAGIMGGGFGNIIDRFFRADGVVDFISVKLYGLFGFEYWPMFNVADMAVVICGILLIVSFFFIIKAEKKGDAE